MKTVLGKFLRKLRLEKGERLKDMADKLDVSSAFLSAVENGKKKMPDTWYEKLANLYELSKEKQNELKNAVIESGETIELAIKGIPTSNRELAISFARHFDTLDEETSAQIFNLLNQKDKEE